MNMNRGILDHTGEHTDSEGIVLPFREGERESKAKWSVGHKEKGSE